MTSPSLRKRRITPPSTHRSSCGNAKSLARAGLAIVALAALPAISHAEPATTRHGPVVVASKSKTRVSPEPAAREVALAADGTPLAGSIPADRPDEAAVRRADAGLRQDKTAARRRTPKKTASRAKVVQAGFQVEPTPEPSQEPGGLVRPFRKISEILPYDTYEPDPETAEQDRCFNLCPRPRGAECPDCKDADESSGDPNAVVCPDCPWEQDLRRIGRRPGEPDIAFIPRNFAHMHYCWEPTNLYHNPIYFEDICLERYGHTRHYLIQPVFSGALLALQLAGLPYQMSIYPVCDKQYSLGYYRPGEFTPCKYYQIPWNTRAALVEAGVITGSYFLFAPGVGP